MDTEKCMFHQVSTPIFRAAAKSEKKFSESAIFLSSMCDTRGLEPPSRGRLQGMIPKGRGSCDAEVGSPRERDRLFAQQECRPSPSRIAFNPLPRERVPEGRVRAGRPNRSNATLTPSLSRFRGRGRGRSVVRSSSRHRKVEPHSFQCAPARERARPFPSSVEGRAGAGPSRL